MLTFGLSTRVELAEAQPGAALPRLKDLVGGWLAAKLERAAKSQKPKQYAHANRTYRDGKAEAWQFLLNQDADDDGTWRTEVRCVVAEPEQRVAGLTVAMRIEPKAAHRLAPIRYYVETPAFIRSLAEVFTVTVGGSVAETTPRRISDEAGVESLLDELRRPERSLPIVVVTEPAHGAPPIPDLARKLISFLFGLAVVADVSRDATFRLSDAIGKEMSCFDGGLRVYWPGWSLQDELRRHPLFLRRRLEISAAHDLLQPDRLIRGSLMAMLTRAAAARFRYPPAMVAVIAADRRRGLLESLATSSNADLIEQISTLTTQVAEQKELSELALAENTQLDDETDDLRRELASARKELERLRGIVAAAGDEAPPEEDPWEIVDPVDAVERARSDFQGTLVIPENIKIETTQPGGFWYHALLALHQLCEADRRGEAANKRTALRDLLARTGLGPKDTYKAGDTGVSVADPETHKDLHCRERVHLVEGKPAETESIYWCTIGETRASYRYLLGRIGRHA